MLQRLYTLACFLLLAACQPAVPVNTAPTAVFATMTPGRFMVGPLPTLAVIPASSGLANPATAIALANQPTATPDFTHCPSVGGPELGPLPDDGHAMVAEMARFLSAGGAPATLENGLRNAWHVIGEDGLFRSDFDLTGEGVPDVMVSFMAPGDGGTLAILVCGDGRYTTRYQWSSGGAPPEVIQVGDMNFDTRPEVLFASQVCDDEADCQYQTQLATWQPTLGRFVSLLDREIDSPQLPTVSDMDNDQVGEIVFQQTDAGNADTGPLRTGITIYDWNGAAYVQSITRVDAPRFRVQVVQEADRALDRMNVEDAISLYTLSLTSPDLEPWRNDEGPILQSYTLFKLMIAHAFAADDQVLTLYQQILDAFPDGSAAPVYVPLSTTFWNAFQVTNNLRSSCNVVREEIRTSRPEAVDLMNRYGSRSPTYTDSSLCPF